MRLEPGILEKAIAFATKAHEGQVRKGNKYPYITHPLAVMLLIAKHKVSKNIILLMVAAVLHDVVEDTEVTIEQIIDEFGPHVGALVFELTDNKEGIAKIGKRQYQLNKWNQLSSYAMALKLADRLHNLRNMMSIPSESAEGQVSDTKWILKRLDRKLTSTHLKLIKKIKKQIKRWDSRNSSQKE